MVLFSTRFDRLSRLWAVPGIPRALCAGSLLVFLGQAGNVNAQVFRVTGTTPPSNRIAVPRTANVVATFNEPLNTTTATLQSLRVYSFLAGGKKAGTATVSGNTLTFAPSTPFQPGERVQAVVSSAAQSSSSGNTLGQAESFTFQFTTATTPSAGTFSGGSDPTVQSIPSDVALGDLDSDGDLDLVTLNSDGNVVSIRLNDGTGTYGGGSDETITTPQASGFVRLGDVDNDGDLDMVVTRSSFNNTTIETRLNNGSGTFQTTNQIPVGFLPNDLVLADIDRDGDLDLLVPRGANIGSVTTYTNDGRGAFGASSTINVGTGPLSLAAGDIDGNGTVDFVTANYYANSLSIGLGNSYGSLGNGPTLAGGSQTRPFNVALGDVDKDGDLDLLFLNEGNATGAGTVSIRLNNGAGTFSGTQEVPVGAVTPSGSNITLGDVDGDGDLDLLVPINYGNSGAVSVRVNNGQGQFTGDQLVFIKDKPVGMALGDVDGDGDLDFVTANQNSNLLISPGTTSVRLNQNRLAPALASVTPDTGPVGSSVVLTGTSLTGTTQVSFNGVATTSFTVNSDTQLTVTIPAGATSGPLTVTSPAGTSNGLAFTVSPRLAVTAVAPTRNSLTAPRTAAVAVSFNQAVLNTASTQQALKVFSQQAGGKKAGSVTVAGSQLTFTSPTGFKAGETVFASVTPGVQSTNQNLTRGQVFQFTTATAPSPGTFTGGSDLAVGTTPTSVATGDVDGDGDLDLVSANYGDYSGTVSVRLNNGLGSYSNGSEFAVGSGVSEVVLADIDSDGDLDLLTANGNTTTVSVRFNNGQGSFGSRPGTPTEVQVGTSPHGIVLGDVDGDGDLDLLAANYTIVGPDRFTTSAVSVRLNNGTGTFSGSTEVSVGSRPLNVALGDLDNDGDLDLVTASSNSATASVRLNNGLGSFSGTQEVAVGFTPLSVTLGDVDKDGDLDLVTANRYDYTNPAGNYDASTASVRLNDGTGTFSGTQNVAIGLGANRVTLGDIDGDGDLDLLATNELSNAIGVQLNNGGGSFSGSQQVAVGTAPSSVILGDLDSDGDLDLLATNRGAGTVSVRLNQGGTTGPLLVTSLAPVRNIVAAPRATAVAVTFNQALSTGVATQGALQVFGTQAGGKKGGTATVSGNTLSFKAGNDFKPGETVFATLTTAAQSSNGASLAKPQVFQFTAATSPSTGSFGGGSDPTAGAAPRGVTTGDIDGDGDLDLLTANLDGNTVSVRLNNGGGAFSGTQEVSVGRGPAQVVLGDVDADGDLDLITANSRTIFPGTVSVRLNNGAGIFSGSTEVSVGDTPHAVAIGDIDGDGDLDLLAANYTAGNSTTNSTVSVRRNNGTGSFSGDQEVSIGTRPLGLAVGDVDNDGDLDFVTANSNTTTASVRLNDGAGSFSGSTEVQVAFNPESVTLGDIDRDGDLDVAVANPALNAVNVRLNNGSGSFSGTQQVAVGTSPHQVVLHDMDGDGDLDLATANTGSASASVRFNDGAGAFTGNQEVSVGAGPVSLTLSDLDGNGTLDLATANNGATTTSVRLSSVAATAQVNKVLAATSARLSQQLSVYPNPAHARVQLQLSAELATQALQVSLLNSLGQVVLEQKLAPQAAELLLPSLPTGVYSLQVRTNQGLISKRLMIE